MKILFHPRAQQQLAERDAWWRQNRGAAVEAFADELEQALAVLAVDPSAWPVVFQHGGRAYRRWRMPTTRCHLYFFVDEVRDAVVVMCAWGAQRGHRPPMPVEEP